MKQLSQTNLLTSNGRNRSFLLMIVTFFSNIDDTDLTMSLILCEFPLPKFIVSPIAFSENKA